MDGGVSYVQVPHQSAPRLECSCNNLSKLSEMAPYLFFQSCGFICRIPMHIFIIQSFLVQECPRKLFLNVFLLCKKSPGLFCIQYTPFLFFSNILPISLVALFALLVSFELTRGASEKQSDAEQVFYLHFAKISTNIDHQG